MERDKVEIRKMAKAGSMESNDIMIMISPGDGEIDIDLDSVVYNQFGDDIKELITDTLKSEGVESAKIVAKDKGALDFTIKARVKTCVKRGSDNSEL